MHTQAHVHSLAQLYPDPGAKFPDVIMTHEFGSRRTIAATLPDLNEPALIYIDASFMEQSADPSQVARTINYRHPLDVLLGEALDDLGDGSIRADRNHRHGSALSFTDAQGFLYGILIVGAHDEVQTFLDGMCFFEENPWPKLL